MNMITRSFPVAFLIGAFVLSACASATPTADTMMEKPTEMVSESHDDVQGSAEDSMEKPTEEMVEPTAEEMMDDEKSEMEPTSEPMEDVEDVMFPEWFSASLVNVNTQDRFKIEDFKGKVILVETLAMWCSTCRRQQNEVVILHEQLGDRDDFISIGLDIDPNEIADDLKTYTQNNGFDWTYAISPPAVSNEIAELYGVQFLNPPSAPMFIIDREGTVHPLRFGVKSADELLETLQPFLDAAM
jgi:hypothetical protein